MAEQRWNPEQTVSTIENNDAREELPFKDAKDRLIEAFERQYLIDLLERHSNVSKAARAAHMDRKSITRLMKKHGYPLGHEASRIESRFSPGELMSG